ncbi:uncharacterized protein LOC125496075 [Beta vulgaris subsp. vulgaris]|uniref:uncharacterized protein LOC125496075 n=1 Tax=Beta vulgaris subsp. vulgaris TaxID=3555 RepID=UPI0025491FEF|nr:uncharacterized protein LOC125496075 [Beta vulgaris subsp. vulgaris]
MKMSKPSGKTFRKKVEGGTNEYEKLRLQRIEANNTKLENLGVKRIMASMKQKKEVSMIKSKATLDEDSDYSPEDDLSDDGNDEEATIANKKRKAHNQDCANKGTKRNFILPGAIGSLLTQSKNVQGKGNKGGNVQLTAALKVIQKAINSQQEAEVQDKMDFDEEMKESDEIGKADVGDSEFHERESDGINARESQKAIDQEDGSMEKKGESMLTGEKEASNETGNAKTKKSYKTKTPRGPTRNLQLAKMRPGEKIKVDFDVSGQPIGVNRAKLSSYCGSLVRDPLNAPLYRIEEFSQVPQENKEKMWKLILDKFDIGLDDVKDQDEREKKIKDKRKYIMTSLNKKYRNFRARLKREYYDTEENDDDRLKEDNRPQVLTKKTGSGLYHTLALQTFRKRVAETLRIGHTLMPDIRQEQKFERDKVMPGLLKLYEETHTRSDKTPVTQSAQDTMNEIKQLVEQRNNSETKMTDEEIYATIKPKRKPSARDRQKGISPSVTSLFGSFSEGEKFRKEAEASKNEGSEAKKEANEVKEKNEALSNTVRGLEKKSRLMERALEAFMNLAGYNMSELNMDAWTDEEDEEELIQKSEKKHNDVED